MAFFGQKKKVKPKDKFKDKLRAIFSIENLKDKLKDIFTLESLNKYKWVIILIILVGGPAILYFSVSSQRAAVLAAQNGSHWNTLTERQNEDVFSATLENPMNFLNSTGTRLIDYNITYSKNPDVLAYTQPNSDYWLLISNVSMIIYLKNTQDMNWSNIVYFATEPENQNLSFGQSFIGTFSLPNSIFALNSSSSGLTINQYKVVITINCTHSYDPGYYIDQSIFEGNIIDESQVISQAKSDASNFALMIDAYYLGVGILVVVFLLIYLRRRKWRFILPY